MTPEVEVEEEDDEGFLTRMSDKLDSDGGEEVSSGAACNDQHRQKDEKNRTESIKNRNQIARTEEKRVRKPGGGVRGEGIRRRPSELREVGHAGRTCDGLKWNRAGSYWAESEPITQPASGKSRRSPVRLRAGVSLLQVRARKHYILHFPSNFVEHLLRMGQSTSRVKRNHYLSWNPLASLDFCHSTSVTTARRSELAFSSSYPHHKKENPRTVFFSFFIALMSPTNAIKAMVERGINHHPPCRGYAER
ncbi:hypothetical protein BHM03_00029193 [Ensete ventricosum]|nr:hypothetical protein BHM03_00029193 [Ensete ventricosum]